MIWLMITVSKYRPKLEFCSMFSYDVAMTFMYELLYFKIASTCKTVMMNAI